MITLEQLRTADTRDIADELAYAIAALINTARMSLENESGGAGSEQRVADAAATLEIALALTSACIDGCDMLQRDAKRGVWSDDAEWRRGAAKREAA
ncbi:hypothetical protein [Tropicimonas sp. IMCC6043]|uniref:hypothetical protein n=1 Tax=Tropicimonas sp. IMCC6043 TaxID=2510645 RepID=UPI00101C29E4|nr:hypothetical protein [Tropicimonas sp. IMCC6043]RYH08888.1 hypothetical protein EU800_14220 [Tropicimonas sp. IMCC6043]